MVSQNNISTATRMGANLVAGGGVTFRVWGPLASAVFLNGNFGDPKWNQQTDDTLMAKDAHGYWTGFVKEAKEGDKYHFFVKGAGSSGFKRDPYARELVGDGTFPNCTCFVREADAYPWHDASFVTPDFSNMVVYQLHIGVYNIIKANTASTFLDIIAKIPYLVSLGINVLQPLPVDETETDPSIGYDGADLFSPDFPFVVTDGIALKNYLIAINDLLKAKSRAPLTIEHIKSGHGQLKALVDLCHVYGIAVVFDVVYNHAGGFSVNNNQFDDNCLYFWDRAKNVGNNNDSLYFTEKDRGTGGLSFALWKNDVRQFLINNAIYYIEEFHVDGFRYDEISSLLSMNLQSGFDFCRDLTNTLRFVKPRLLQNAEYWPFEFGDFPKSSGTILASTSDGGAGFDVLQHDGIREAVRGAVHSASFGQNSSVNIRSIQQNLFPVGLTHGWQAVTCVENHDKVKVGAEPRIVTLADSSNRRTWFARSRARFASGILLTAPGIPQIFMGQEFLEDKQWDWHPKSSNLLFWDGLKPIGGDTDMKNFLHFMQDLIRVRWNQPALRGDNVNPFFASDADRVIAFHRWLDVAGEDVVVVATLSDTNWFNYSVGFPFAGLWREIFNSDAYDGHPQVAGNGGGINASGAPMHGFPASASIVIPANGLVVFART